MLDVAAKHASDSRTAIRQLLRISSLPLYRLLQCTHSYMSHRVAQLQEPEPTFVLRAISKGGFHEAQLKLRQAAQAPSLAGESVLFRQRLLRKSLHGHWSSGKVRRSPEEIAASHGHPDTPVELTGLFGTGFAVSDRASLKFISRVHLCG